VGLVKAAGAVALAALRRTKSYTRRDGSIVATDDPDFAGCVRALGLAARLAGALAGGRTTTDASEAAQLVATELTKVAEALNAAKESAGGDSEP
jgi:hypothetical protein